jgi:ubiquinol-cytochrome c reductase cytochrome b subunit
MSYWGAQVIVNLFSTVPFIGEDPGPGSAATTISDVTLNRFFALHVAAQPLPLLILVAVPDGVARGGVEQPDGIRSKQPKDPATGIYLDGIHSYPYYDQGHRRRGVLLAILDRGVLHSRRRRVFPGG